MLSRLEFIIRVYWRRRPWWSEEYFWKIDSGDMVVSSETSVFITHDDNIQTLRDFISDPTLIEWFLSPIICRRYINYLLNSNRPRIMYSDLMAWCSYQELLQSQNLLSNSIIESIKESWFWLNLKCEKCKNCGVTNFCKYPEISHFYLV